MSASNDTVQRFSYKKANNIMTDTEKARLLCVAITALDRAKPTSEDLKLAAAQFGAAEGGFAKSYSNHLKKLRDQECYIIDSEDVSAIPTTPASGSTPAKTPKSTPKRKAAEASGEGEGAEEKTTPAKKTRASAKKAATATTGEEGETGGEAPTPKKRGRPAKKAATPKKSEPKVEDEEGDEEVKDDVKSKKATVESVGEDKTAEN